MKIIVDGITKEIEVKFPFEYDFGLMGIKYIIPFDGRYLNIEAFNFSAHPKKIEWIEEQKVRELAIKYYNSKLESALR